MIMPCLNIPSQGLIRCFVMFDTLLRLDELVARLSFFFLNVYSLFLHNVFLIFASQKQPIDAGFRITTLVFFTPKERIMNVPEAQRRGYGIVNTPTRLVLRIPKTSPEMYTQNVSGTAVH